MALEITEEFAKEHNLTAEQVTAVAAFGNEYSDNLVADTKKEYDGKANADAEGILTGAAKSIAEDTGIERDQGEKMAEYIKRVRVKSTEKASSDFFKSKEAYDEKLKNFKGDEATAKELEDLSKKYDEALLKYADFDKHKEDADKYPDLLASHSKMKEEVSFGQVKPNFPDTANEFEVDKRWDNFKAATLKAYNIEMVDGVATAIDKENEHITVPLKELLGKDEDITKLLEGRQQKGTGSKQGKHKQIEGIPFDIPEGSDGSTVEKLITDHLIDKGLAFTSKEFSDQFGELYKKIREQKNA